MSEKLRFTGDVITSRQNRRIVELMKLDDRRVREKNRLFRFDGIKLLCEAIRRKVELDGVFLRVGTAERVSERMMELYGCTLAQAGCPIFGVEDGLFEKISQENAPEGVITVAKYIDKCHKNIIIYNKDEFPPRLDAAVILLESVRDPLNVGAIIRSAAALGVGHLFLSADCADIYHPRTVRAAMGPLFSMPITRVEDLAGTVRALRADGRRVYAAALDDTAVRLGSPELAEEQGSPAVKSCAVIGNEGHGLSEAVIRACDRSVYIPMEAGTESLNAGVAAALIMWELCKK
ncbi:MAG: RNA methyltransferase [Clostridia bacterium]|nr:RNA methyltransferase [Clostridia bacterium]